MEIIIVMLALLSSLSTIMWIKTARELKKMRDRNDNLADKVIDNYEKWIRNN